MSQRKIVRRTENILSEYSSCSFSELQSICSQAIKQYVQPEFADSAKFEVETYTEAYSDSTYAALFLHYSDYETEEEKVKRETQEKENIARREAHEKAEFERLSKKFAKN